MKKLLQLALLLLPALAFAQNVRVDIPWPSITSQYATPFLVANVPPNSPVVSVCQSPANQVPCTNYVTTFDSLGNPCANGSQDTPQPQPSACQATGDAQGNIGFWIPAGKYDITVCIQNNCLNSPYTVTPGGSGGGSAGNTGNPQTRGSSGALVPLSVVVADNFAGADWCAKAVAADTALGATSGEIWVTQAAGTSLCSAALALSQNHTLRFTSGGAFVLSCHGITLTSVSNVNIIGTAGASISLPNSCANFSRPINVLTSTNVLVENLEINGNGSNQQTGEQDANIEINDSSQVKILNNYLHDAQGDAINVNTDSSLTAGCDDVLVEGNTFRNIGRQFWSLTGYGCNDVRVLGNHFTVGSQVTTSTSHGNAIHVEGDFTGATSFHKITIANNDIAGAVGTCISATSQDTSPIVGIVIAGNQCSGTNSSINLSAGIAALMIQDASIANNTVNMTGATSGTDGILVQEAPGVAAQAHRSTVHDNTIEGPSSNGVRLTSSASSGTPEAFLVHHNIIDTVAGYGILVVNNFSDLDIADNIITNTQIAAVRLEAPARFDFHDNTIRDFGLVGGAINGLEVTCNSLFTTVGPGRIHDNEIGSATTTSKTGISGACGGATNIFVYNNDTAANATGVSTGTGYTDTIYPASLPSSFSSPLTIGTTSIFEDAAGSTLAQRNSTTPQVFNIWGSYPSGEFLKLSGNYAGGDPGVQCSQNNCNLNLSSSSGTGSIYFRTAYNGGGIGMFLDQNAKLNLNGAFLAASVSTQLLTSTAPTVTPTLGSATTWTYKIVVKDASGNAAAASGGGSTVLGAATLDGTHFNTITWPAAVGAVSYDVYRTAVGASPPTTGKIGTASIGSTSLVDNGLAGDSSTAPTVNTTGGIPVPYLQTTSNCSNGATPAVCASAPTGAVAVPTGTNPTLQINTTAITALSRIFLTIDESLTIAATTCNTTLTTLVQPVVTARSAGVSFTIQIPATLASNPACVSYMIVN